MPRDYLLQALECDSDSGNTEHSHQWK